MSIKLYYAYRFPANKLNEFLDIVTEFSIKKNGGTGLAYYSYYQTGKG